MKKIILSATALAMMAGTAFADAHGKTTVSYTHLTLPTSDLV